MGLMAKGDFIIEFWDVGQGDCTIVHLPDGQLILVDVGPIGSPVVDWLSKHRNKKIHSIILSHNDSDHIGALTPLLRCCQHRVESVFLLDDRNTRNESYFNLFRGLKEAEQRGEIGRILRLEAPMQIWPDGNTAPGDLALKIKIEVLHPTLAENVLARTPNETSAIILLSPPASFPVLLASDASVSTVAATVAGRSPSYMLGPHHGGPIDRRQKQFQANLQSINPQCIVASVGTNNRYNHPCANYIKHARCVGASFICTQLTINCEKRSRLRHVFNGAAFLGLPQSRKGYSCRGTVRLRYNGREFGQDTHADAAHASEIHKLSRPLCLK